MDEPLPSAVLAALRTIDTPTVCNALEIVAPDRRGFGYTTAPFFCADRTLEPMVGYARTGTVRAQTPPNLDPDAAARLRLGYYDHIGEGPGPTITVIQDLDEIVGYGAWWGEVNTNIHKGLGSLGVITDGSVRDLDDAAAGFQMLAGMVNPSHAWIRIEEYGIPVTVHGMRVEPGDLIHADQHGAVVVPLDAAPDIPDAAAELAAKEQVLITASQQPGFTSAQLYELLGIEPGH
ncbi:MAG: RraA family protein [Acidimicrobiales bacterium]|nr:RraA family protein [Acidimicrobiales bacterium]RZV48266.1 MAG: RraA family protein [Acidimicrobiales bacterium]